MEENKLRVWFVKKGKEWKLNKIEQEWQHLAYGSVGIFRNWMNRQEFLVLFFHSDSTLSKASSSVDHLLRSSSLICVSILLNVEHYGTDLTIFCDSFDLWLYNLLNFYASMFLSLKSSQKSLVALIVQWY